jgi:hypothetical protein
VFSPPLDWPVTTVNRPSRKIENSGSSTFHYDVHDLLLMKPGPQPLQIRDRRIEAPSLTVWLFRGRPDQDAAKTENACRRQCRRSAQRFYPCHFLVTEELAHQA